MSRFGRILFRRREPSIRTTDGVRVRAGLRVHDPARGRGTVLRVLDAEGIVVRWDKETVEPRRTTFVPAQALLADPARREIVVRARPEPAPEAAPEAGRA
jgi:hypothetical protein